MTTALDLVNAAARRLGIIASGDALDTNQAADALFALNLIIDNWRLENIDMYLSDVALTDTLFLENGYKEALISELVPKIAPEYGIQVTPDMQQQAINAKRAIVKAGVTPLRGRRDATLMGMSGRRFRRWDDLSWPN